MIRKVNHSIPVSGGVLSDIFVHSNILTSCISRIILHTTVSVHFSTYGENTTYYTYIHQIWDRSSEHRKYTISTFSFNLRALLIPILDLIIHLNFCRTTGYRALTLYLPRHYDFGGEESLLLLGHHTPSVLSHCYPRQSDFGGEESLLLLGHLTPLLLSPAYST